VRGKATLSGGDTFKQSAKCHKGGKTMTEHTTSHTGTKWSSERGLKFKENAFSDFKTVLDGTNSGWSKLSYN
jgi:hypothetical protein